MITPNKKMRNLCACGCGELANPKRRYIIGHHLKGKIGRNKICDYPK